MRTWLAIPMLAVASLATNVSAQSAPIEAPKPKPDPASPQETPSPVESERLPAMAELPWTADQIKSAYQGRMGKTSVTRLGTTGPGIDESAGVSVSTTVTGSTDSDCSLRLVMRNGRGLTESTIRRSWKDFLADQPRFPQAETTIQDETLATEAGTFACRRYMRTRKGQDGEVQFTLWLALEHPGVVIKSSVESSISQTVAVLVTPFDDMVTSPVSPIHALRPKTGDKQTWKLDITTATPVLRLSQTETREVLSATDAEIRLKVERRDGEQVMLSEEVTLTWKQYAERFVYPFVPQASERCKVEPEELKVNGKALACDRCTVVVKGLKNASTTHTSWWSAASPLHLIKLESVKSDGARERWEVAEEKNPSQK